VYAKDRWLRYLVWPDLYRSHLCCAGSHYVICPNVGHSVIPAFLRHLLQILVEPHDGLFQAVDLVFGFDEHMAFAGINDQLGWYAQRL